MKRRRSQAVRIKKRDLADRRGFTEQEAANYIGMSSHFLRYDRCYGAYGGRASGPRWIKVGRAVRYLIEDLDAWLESHRVERRDPPNTT